MDLFTQWLLVGLILAVAALLGVAAWGMDRKPPSKPQRGIQGLPPSPLLPHSGVRIVDYSVPVSKHNRMPYDQETAE
jgi:hypothetical protein